MLRVFTNSAHAGAIYSDKLWVSGSVLHRLVFATIYLGTIRGFVRSLYFDCAIIYTPLISTINRGFDLFIHRFHNPNNMYYKKEIRLL